MNSKRQKIRKGIVLFSFLLFPITIFYFSPYLAIQAGMVGIVAGCLIIFTVQFAISLFFGRAFCGWICPVAGLTEGCSVVTSKRAKNGKARYIKYMIWTPWVIAILWLFIIAGEIKGVDPFFMTEGGLPMLGIPGHVVYFGIVILIAVMTLAGGQRIFCHTLCWMAPFMVIGTKIKEALRYPSLKIRTDGSRCIGCGLCSKKCPMNLDTEGMAKADRMQDSECILCGECVDSCKHDVFKYYIR